MKSSQEIINKIKEYKEDIDDINNIPRTLSFRDKAILVQARIELSKALQGIIDFAEGQESSERKNKKHELIP